MASTSTGNLSLTLRDMQSAVDSAIATGVSCPVHCVRALNDAIRLRELFNACCPVFMGTEFKTSNAEHQFFISFLKKCQAKILRATRDSKTGNTKESALPPSSTATSSSSVFSINLYDVLLQDTANAHVSDEEEKSTAASSPSTSAASAKESAIDFMSKDVDVFVCFGANDNVQRRILDDSLRCFCLLLDAGVLLHQVHDAWTYYSQGKVSLVVAHAIANEAILMIQSLHQQIQLECPYIHGLYEVHAFVFAAPTIHYVVGNSFKKGKLIYEEAVKVVSDGLKCHFNFPYQAGIMKNDFAAEWMKKWMDEKEVDDVLQRLRVQYSQAVSLHHTLRTLWIQSATQQAHCPPFVWDEFLVGKCDIRVTAAMRTTHQLSVLNSGRFNIPDDPLIANIWDEVKSPANDVRQLTVLLLWDILPTLFRLGDLCASGPPQSAPSAFLELARAWATKNRNQVIGFAFTFAIHCLLISIMCVQSPQRGFMRHVMSCRSAMNKLQERVKALIDQDSSGLTTLRPLKQHFQGWLAPFANTKAFDEFFFDSQRQCFKALQQIYDDQKMTLTNSVLYNYCTKEQSYRALFHPLMAGYDMTAFYFVENMQYGMACLESASTELRLILHLYHALKCTHYISSSEHIPLFELLTERFLAAKVLRVADFASGQPPAVFKTFLLDMGFKAELFAASKNMLEKRKKGYATQATRSRAALAKNMVYANTKRLFQPEVLSKLSPAYRRLMQRDFADVSTASDQPMFGAIVQTIVQDCLPDRFYSLNFVSIADLCLRLVELLVDAFQLREYLENYNQGGDEECRKLLEKNALTSSQSITKVVHLFMLLHLCDFAVDDEKMSQNKIGKEANKETEAADEKKEMENSSHSVKRASLVQLSELCNFAIQTYHSIQGGVTGALGVPFALIGNAADIGAQIPGIHSCLSLCAAVLIEFMKFFKEDAYQLMRI